MIKNARMLIGICLMSIAGVIVLQFFWINNYYHSSLFNFEREINLSFEDAIKKEFQLRNDTIEQLLVQQLMDTTRFRISSDYNSFVKKEVYTISDAKKRKDLTTVSYEDLEKPLKLEDTALKRQIADRFAKSLRSEDLENHIIYYRTQSLGNFENDKVKEFAFDTNRLRPILSHYLKKRNIYTKFHFLTSGQDSLFNQINYSDSLKKKGVIITKAYPTYKWWNSENQYVRAVFENPIVYVMGKMKWIFSGSIVLVFLVSVCIWLLIKALFHEKKLTRIKNDFINNITHELKTPVATITAATEALEDFNLSEIQHRRYLSHARNEAKKLSDLIDSILAISLHGKNAIKARKESIDVENTILALIDNLKISANKPVNFSFENRTGIDHITADPHLYIQALTNILQNAIKYSEHEVNIFIDCFITHQHFHIRCTDNGVGITSEAMPYIYEKFYREPRNDHSIKGYGLGLSYVREIMRIHRGKVEITSTKGKGTVVILSWPLPS